MVEILKLGVILTLGIIGVFIIFGFVIEVLNKQSRRLVYRAFGTPGLYVTSFIGTPVHEFGHYIMCKIFRHRVLEVKWFIPSAVRQGSVLGYVRHGRSNRLYQKIGDFFIGIGPLIVGSMVVVLLSRVLLPDTFHAILSMSNINFKDIMASIFSLNNLKSFKFWIFIILVVSICSHMSLSREDINNSSFGVVTLFIINLVFSFIIVTMKIDTTMISKFLYNYNLICVILMSVAILIILFTMVISKLICLIRRK